MTIPVGLDFETYYDRATYTLSRLTTEEYVRDPRFQAIGVSVKIGFDGESVWYPRPRIDEGLATVPWDKALLIAHNSAFDGSILGWIYNRYPKAYACTMSMSRALGMNFYGGASLKAQVALANAFDAGLPPKTDEVEEFNGYRYENFNVDQLARYGAYCMNDTTSTMGLFRWYVEKLGFPASEMAAMSEIISMFTYPRLHLDKGLLKARLEAVRHRRDVLLDRMGVTVTQVRSDAILAGLLEGMGVDPPTKLSPKKKNADGTPMTVYAFAATDQGMKDLAEHDDLQVQTLIACRLKSKSTIEESRMQRLIGIAERGALPVPYKYYGAHTGRIAAEGKINMANNPRPVRPRRLDEGMLVKINGEYLPISRINNTGSKFMVEGRDDQFMSSKYLLASIRDCIIAPPGYMLVVADSAQIEARILAWLAQEDEVLAAFARGDDVYVAMASDIYDREITKANTLERFVGKEAVLGLGYQMGADKFQKSVKAKTNPQVILDIEFCKGVVQVFRAKRCATVKLWGNNSRALDAMIRGEPFDIGRPGVCVALPADKTDPMPRIRLPNGMYLRYPGLEMERTVDEKGQSRKKYSYLQAKGKSQVRTGIYGGKNTENEAQALARIVITDQWMRINKRMRKEGITTRSAAVLHSYDEVVMCVPTAAAEDTLAVMLSEMSISPSFMPGIPVAAEGGYAQRYGDAK